MRWTLAAVFAVGCYSPAADPTCAITCTIGVANACPDGLACFEGTCRDPANPSCRPPTDASLVDTALDPDGMFCIGSDNPLKVCLSAMPTNDVTVSAPTAVETSLCANVLQHEGQSLCVYTYRTLTVEASMSFQGPRAAVLVVAGDVKVEATGSISVASSDSIAGAGTNPSACTPPTTASDAEGLNSGGGGGAGGSFASAGGFGGEGGSASAIGGGPALAVAGPYVTLRGGCSGAPGGNDDTGFNRGLGGAGGGAIAILSSSSITVNGDIRAFGEGGGGAQARIAGGGGGGSGGMILVDALVLAGTGYLNANGGGGGGGGSELGAGLRGFEPELMMRTSGGKGGMASINGGTGGDGGSTSEGLRGLSAVHGGGGGGGGGGVVLLRGSVTGTLKANPVR